MKASNMNAVKFIVIVLVALALRMAAVVVCGGDPVAGVHQYREIVAACKVFPFALGMLAMAYGALLAVYLTFRRYWAGRPAQQGLVFGSLFGLIWVVGMIEGSLVLATSLKHVWSLRGAAYPERGAAGRFALPLCKRGYSDARCFGTNGWIVYLHSHCPVIFGGSISFLFRDQCGVGLPETPRRNLSLDARDGDDRRGTVSVLRKNFARISSRERFALQFCRIWN